FGYEIRDNQLILKYYNDIFSRVSSGLDNYSIPVITVSLTNEDSTPYKPDIKSIPDHTSTLQVLNSFKTIRRISMLERYTGGISGKIITNDYFYADPQTVEKWIPDVRGLVVPMWMERNIYDFNTGRIEEQGKYFDVTSKELLSKRVPGRIIRYKYPKSGAVSRDVLLDECDSRLGRLRKEFLPMGGEIIIPDERGNEIVIGEFVIDQAYGIKAIEVDGHILRSYKRRTTYFALDSDGMVRIDKEGNKITKPVIAEICDISTGNPIARLVEAVPGAKFNTGYSYFSGQGNIFLGISGQVNTAFGEEEFSNAEPVGIEYNRETQAYQSTFEFTRIGRTDSGLKIPITMTVTYNQFGDMVEKIAESAAGKTVTRVLRNNKTGEEIGRVLTSQDGTIIGIGIFEDYVYDDEIGAYLAFVKMIDPIKIGWSQTKAKDFINKLEKSSGKLIFKEFDSGVKDNFIETRSYLGERLVDQVTLSAAGLQATRVLYNNKTGEEIGRVVRNAKGEVVGIGISKGYVYDSESGLYVVKVEMLDVNKAGWTKEENKKNINRCIEEIKKQEGKMEFKNIDPKLDESIIEIRLYSAEKLIEQTTESYAGRISTRVIYNRKTNQEIGRVVKSQNGSIIGIGIFDGYEYDEEAGEYFAKVKMLNPAKALWTQEQAQDFVVALRTSGERVDFKEFDSDLNENLIETCHYSEEKLIKQKAYTVAGWTTTRVYYNRNTRKELGRVVRNNNKEVIDIGVFVEYDKQHNSIVHMLDPIRARLTDGGEAIVEKLKKGEKPDLEIALRRAGVNPDYAKFLIIERVYSGENLVSQLSTTVAGEAKTRVYYDRNTAQEIGRIVRSENGSIIGLGIFDGYQYDEKMGEHLAKVKMFDPSKIKGDNEETKKYQKELVERIEEDLENGIKPDADFGLIKDTHKDLIQVRLYSGEKLASSVACGVTATVYYNKDTAQEVGRVESMPDEESDDGPVITGIGVFDGYDEEGSGISTVRMIDTRRAGLEDTQFAKGDEDKKLGIIAALENGEEISFSNYGIPERLVKTREYSGEDLDDETVFSEAGRVRTEVEYDKKEHGEKGRTAYAIDEEGGIIGKRLFGEFNGYDPDTGFTKVKMEDALTHRTWTETLNPIGILLEIIHTDEKDGVKKHTKQSYDGTWLPTDSETVVMADGFEKRSYTGRFFGYINGYAKIQLKNENNEDIWQEVTNQIGENKAHIYGVMVEGEFVEKSLAVSYYAGLLGHLGIVTDPFTYEYDKKLNENNIFRTDRDEAFIEGQVVNSKGEKVPVENLVIEDLIDGKPLYQYYNEEVNHAWQEVDNKDGMARAKINGKIKDDKFNPSTIEITGNFGFLKHFNIGTRSRTFKYRKAIDERLESDRGTYISVLEDTWFRTDREGKDVPTDGRNPETFAELSKLGLRKFAFMLDRNGNIPSDIGYESLNLDDLVDFEHTVPANDQHDGYTVSVKKSPLYRTYTPLLRHATEELKDAKGRVAVKYTCKLKGDEVRRIKGTLSWYDDLAEPYRDGSTRYRPKHVVSGISREGNTYGMMKDGSINYAKHASKSIFEGVDSDTKLVLATFRNMKNKQTWQEEREGSGRLVNKYKVRVEDEKMVRTRKIMLHYDDSEQGLGDIDVADMGQTYVLNKDGSFYLAGASAYPSPFKISWFSAITAEKGHIEEGYIDNQIVNLKTVETWFEIKD
ncbi:MAG: hypothetical protein HQ579_03955, partial [Candidatus Omnitrophica bacterium]|nr:hypothetical protein [Candidatus Omnitrophota bacterium]